MLPRKPQHFPDGQKCFLERKKVHSGDPTGAVACMAALLGCPVSLRKWCCGASKMHVLAPQGPENAIEGSYAAGAMLQGVRCTGYAAGAVLQELCCKDYAAGMMQQAQCCKGYHAGYAARAMPHLVCCTCSAAGAMLQGLRCKGCAAGAMLRSRWSAHNAVAF